MDKCCNCGSKIVSFSWLLFCMYSTWHRIVKKKTFYMGTLYTLRCIIIYCPTMYFFFKYYQGTTRGMLLLTKAKRPLKFKMLCDFNKHAVKLRMHKAAPYAFPIPLNTF